MNSGFIIKADPISILILINIKSCIVVKHEYLIAKLLICEKHKPRKLTE